MSWLWSSSADDPGMVNDANILGNSEPNWGVASHPSLLVSTLITAYLLTVNLNVQKHMDSNVNAPKWPNGSVGSDLPSRQVGLNVHVASGGI